MTFWLWLRNVAIGLIVLAVGAWIAVAQGNL